MGKALLNLIFHIISPSPQSHNLYFSSFIPLFRLTAKQPTRAADPDSTSYHHRLNRTICTFSLSYHFFRLAQLSSPQTFIPCSYQASFIPFLSYQAFIPFFCLQLSSLQEQQILTQNDLAQAKSEKASMKNQLGTVSRMFACVCVCVGGWVCGWVGGGCVCVCVCECVFACVCVHFCCALNILLCQQSLESF
jgi:hypothetical protein